MTKEARQFVIWSSEADDPDREQLRAALTKIASIDDLTIVAITGPSDQPKRFLVAGSKELVTSLVSEFSPIVRVEPDATLTLE